MKKLVLVFVFVCVTSAAMSVFGQTPTPTPVNDDDADVIRVSTTLIQVDVVVVDKDKRPVTNLKKEDFEVYENGVKQELSGFDFISPRAVRKSNISSEDTLGMREEKDGTSLDEKIAVPSISTATNPNSVRRTLVLVVDNLGLSFTSVGLIKQSLEKFIKEQIKEGDLVTIVTTGGASVLPAFTSDKKQLLSIVKQIKWRWAKQGRSRYL